MGRERDPEREILDAVRAIPPGFVRTYGDLWPPAPRLAGRVLADTQAPGLPWWRVVRADGSLAIGEEQRRRLDAEGVPFRGGGSRRVDLRVARLPAGLEPAGPRRSLRR
jgi:methylated-DNA-protein-cysteine methyltransferase related protein